MWSRSRSRRWGRSRRGAQADSPISGLEKKTRKWQKAWLGWEWGQCRHIPYDKRDECSKVGKTWETQNSMLWGNLTHVLNSFLLEITGSEDPIKNYRCDNILFSLRFIPVNAPLTAGFTIAIKFQHSLLLGGKHPEPAF